MLFAEHAGAAGHPPKVKIFASDVHQESLEFAAAGLYREESMGDVSAARRQRFFRRIGDPTR